MTQHSDIVGGSTAKRVINCPGSVALVAQMPPKPSSKYADTGTLLHDAMSEILDNDKSPESVLGNEYEGIVLDDALLDRKVRPALEALNEIDPEKKMEFATEIVVGFGDLLPDVFGSCDLVGRLGDTAVILDWKFGDGVAVDVEENPQLMFYAAAAMRTPAAQWAFDGATKVECVIVQPPFVKRWQTTLRRIELFEKELLAAVKKAKLPDAPLAKGDHCRWCAAKPICPLLTGAVDRALQAQIKSMNAAQISKALAQADLLEQWITDVRALAHQMLDEGAAVPGYKLVPKRATRQWVNEDAALDALRDLGVKENELMETSIISPAKAEKVLKKHKLDMPVDLVVAISTGNTLAPENDPRPAVLQIGKQLSVALGKLV